jgi:hypothetical protein
MQGELAVAVADPQTKTPAADRRPQDHPQAAIFEAGRRGTHRSLVGGLNAGRPGDDPVLAGILGMKLAEDGEPQHKRGRGAEQRQISAKVDAHGISTFERRAEPVKTPALPAPVRDLSHHGDRENPQDGSVVATIAIPITAYSKR